jgi:hypothetical protein
MLARLKQVFATREAAAAPVYFQVECRCGEQVRGARLATPQTVSCPRCGEPRFIFPLSPLPKTIVGSNVAPRTWRWRLWAFPALAVLTTALILLLTYWWLFPRQDNSPGDNSPSVREQLEAAKREFADGKSRVAAETFARIYSTRASELEKLSAAERRQWQQLAREVSLHADLLAEDLTEIVQQAVDISARASEDEWLAVFRQRYQGKSILFDITFQRSGDGMLEIPDSVTALRVGKVLARLDLRELKLLQDLNLNQQSRVLFGARLASCQRKENHWSIEFDLESGVLLTQARAAINQCRAWTDEESRQILRAQEKGFEVAR